MKIEYPNKDVLTGRGAVARVNVSSGELVLTPDGGNETLTVAINSGGSMTGIKGNFSLPGGAALALSLSEGDLTSVKTGAPPADPATGSSGGFRSFLSGLFSGGGSSSRGSANLAGTTWVLTGAEGPNAMTIGEGEISFTSASDVTLWVNMLGIEMEFTGTYTVSGNTINTVIEGYEGNGAFSISGNTMTDAHGNTFTKGAASPRTAKAADDDNASGGGLSGLLGGLLGSGGNPSGGSGNWTLVTNTTFEYSINAITYGNGKFVAVGYDGKIAYSSDGINWTAVADSTFGDGEINAIAFGNGKFVAVGYGGRIAYSSDGVTWTAVADSTFSEYRFDGIYAIAWGNNKFVAGGEDGSMAYSSDGINWTAVADTKFITNLNGIAWGNNKFVAVAGWSSWDSPNTIATSPDGINWTAVQTKGSNVIGDYTRGFDTEDIDAEGVVWGSNKFVAVSPSDGILYSADGTNWTVNTGTYDVPLFLHNYGSIAWGGNRFVAGGGQGQGLMVTSSDGINWTKMTDNALGTMGGSTIFGDIGYEIYAVAYGGNKFVAAGEDGRMAYWQP